MITFLRRLFAPRGTLLIADILAETTVHVLSSGERKAIISKFEDGPGLPVRQQLVQALIFTAAEVAQQGGIRIDWELVSRVCPQPPVAPQPGGANNA